MTSWGHLVIRPAVSKLWLLHVDHHNLNFCSHLPLALLLYFFFSRGRPSSGFRIMTTYFQRSPLTGSYLCNISHLSLPWKQWGVLLLYYPATTWKVTPTTQETSFFTPFFFPASHFFTDGVKLCSTNCLNIKFSAVGSGWGMLPESTEKEYNPRNVFDTVINYIYHTILQEVKHLPWVPEPKLLSKKPPTVSVQSHFVLAWVFSRLRDHYEPTWNNILQQE